MRFGALAMSQQIFRERRSGIDRRTTPRCTPDRRDLDVWQCIVKLIGSIYKWTDVPAQSGEAGLFKRNWRTWFGHMTVSAVVVAFGRWLGLHVGFFFPAIGPWIPVVACAAVGGFYFWREFGVHGDYWKRRKGYDSKSDSVLDFWVVLIPIVILMQISAAYAVLIAILMAMGIYLMSRNMDYNG